MTVSDAGDTIYVDLGWTLCGAVELEGDVRRVTDLWIEDDHGRRLVALDWLVKTVAAAYVARIVEAAAREIAPGEEPR